MTTTIEAPKEFGGRPINGEISYYGEDEKPQKPVEELTAALDAVLAFDEVVAVRWRQYTPYFNDGDPCTFSAYGFGVKLVGGAEEAGDYEDGFYNVYPSYPDDYWQTHYRWRNEAGKLPEDVRDARWEPYELEGDKLPRLELQKAVLVLNEAIEGGAHYAILRHLFGDPAEVTATREGYNVEHYDHD